MTMRPDCLVSRWEWAWPIVMTQSTNSTTPTGTSWTPPSGPTVSSWPPYQLPTQYCQVCILISIKNFYHKYCKAPVSNISFDNSSSQHTWRIYIMMISEQMQKALKSVWKYLYLFSLPVLFIDGKYYITVRAINRVEYGGPLATSVCHSTAYAIDNSPPIVYEIFNVQYNEETYNLTLSHNSS